VNWRRESRSRSGPPGGGESRAYRDRATLSGEVALKNAVPNVTYEVLVIQYPSCQGTKATLTTHKQGNGSLHFTTERRPLNTKFFVDVFRPFPFLEEFNSPAVELD
jgi:hypothetical protein